MELNNREFKAFGRTIETLSLYYGIFLILLGLAVSFVSDSSSFTSYIPSLLGCLIALFSFLSIIYPNKKKLFMHIVVFFILTTALGGLDVTRGLTNGNLFSNFWADLTKTIMAFTGSYFIYLCVQSFRFARKNKAEDKN